MKILYRFYLPCWKSFRFFKFNKIKKLPIYQLQILGNEFFIHSKNIIVTKLTHSLRRTKPNGFFIDISNLKNKKC